MPRVNPCLLNTPSGLYALGGRSGEQAMNIVEYYDPHRDTWMPAHSMTKARCYFGAVEANGMLYAIDGMKDNVSIHKSTEMLDPRIVLDTVSSRVLLDWRTVCRERGVL